MIESDAEVIYTVGYIAHIICKKMGECKHQSFILTDIGRTAVVLLDSIVSDCRRQATISDEMDGCWATLKSITYGRSVST